MKELQEKIQIPSANISFFITTKKAMKQAWLHRATSTLLSHEQPARNQTMPPLSLSLEQKLQETY